MLLLLYSWIHRRFLSYDVMPIFKHHIVINNRNVDLSLHLWMFSLSSIPVSESLSSIRSRASHIWNDDEIIEQQVVFCFLYLIPFFSTNGLCHSFFRLIFVRWFGNYDKTAITYYSRMLFFFESLLYSWILQSALHSTANMFSTIKCNN